MATNVGLLTPGSANQQARWTNGQYYTAECQATTLAEAINTLTAHPLWVPPVPPGGTAHTITRLGITVSGSGGAGSIVRLGVYNDNGSGVPGALLLDVGLQAVIDGTAAPGSPEIILTTALILTSTGAAAGTPLPLVWLAAVNQVAAPTVNVISGTTGGKLPIGSASLSAALNTSRPNGYQVSGVTGALPSTWTGATTIAAPILVGAKVT